MSNPQNSLYDLQMFLTTDYPCSYLPGRQARNLVADPAATDCRTTHDLLIKSQMD